MHRTPSVSIIFDIGLRNRLFSYAHECHWFLTNPLDEKAMNINIEIKYEDYLECNKWVLWDRFNGRGYDIFTFVSACLVPPLAISIYNQIKQGDQIGLDIVVFSLLPFT